MGRLEGRVAIVTGAGSGNGLAIARAFANEGAAVVIGEYSAQRGAAAAESMQASGEALFVARYLDFSVERNQVCATATQPKDYCGPVTYPPLPCRLLHSKLNPKPNHNRGTR